MLHVSTVKIKVFLPNVHWKQILAQMNNLCTKMLKILQTMHRKWHLPFSQHQFHLYHIASQKKGLSSNVPNEQKTSCGGHN